MIFRVLRPQDNRLRRSILLGGGAIPTRNFLFPEFKLGHHAALDGRAFNC